MIDVLDAAADIAEKMKVVVEIVSNASAQRRRIRPAARVRRLMKNLQPDLQVGNDLPRHDQSSLAEILSVPDAIEFAAAAAKCRPRTPVLFDPDRQQKRGMLIADIRHTRAYARELERAGLTITDQRSLGIGFWYAFGPECRFGNLESLWRRFLRHISLFLR